MSKLQALLQTAASQVGYRAGADDDTKYGAWYGLNYNPWCMMFVSWCAAQAGIGEDIIPKMAYCPYAVVWFTSRGRFCRRGADSPRAGDIIFFSNDGAGASHVGIIEKTAAGRIHTIEGNSGNQVKRCSYPLADSYILGWGRPAYDQAKEEAMEISDISIYLVDSKSTVKVKGCVDQGVTFIKLRDAEKLFPVSVGWDESSHLATVALNYKA